MDSPYWPYICIILLIVFSAFFSSSEIAYVSSNRLRLKKAAETGGLRARTAFSIYENFNGMISTILIGNNLVNMSASSLATVIAMSLVGESGAAAGRPS
jgi:Mg2+/Co2+ transporter CorB